MLTISDGGAAISKTATAAKPDAPKGGPDKAEPKSKAKAPAPSFIEKALTTVGLKGAAKAAKEGARDIAQAGKQQPTPERAVVATVVEAAKSQGKIAAAAAGDVAKAGKKVAERLTEPVRREGAEAAREIGAAGKNVVDTAKKSAAEGRAAVKKAWESQPTPERAVIASGYELIKQGLVGQARTLGSVANLGKEALEGAFEVAINNPIIEAGRIGVSEAAKGAAKLGRSLIGFGLDVGARGANGAAKAADSAKQSAWGIAERTIEQQRENAKEITGAATKLGRDYVDNFKLVDDEVTKAWNDAPTIERKIAFAAYETAENMVEGTVENITNGANLAKEVIEAGVENTVMVGKNVVDAVTAGPKAIGSFVKGWLG